LASYHEEDNDEASVVTPIKVVGKSTIRTTSDWSKSLGSTCSFDLVDLEFTGSMGSGGDVKESMVVSDVGKI